MVWLAQPSGANAQSDAEILAGIRACQGVPSSSARLACYDSVLSPDDLDAGETPSDAREREAVTDSAPESVQSERRRAEVALAPVPGEDTREQSVRLDPDAAAQLTSAVTITEVRALRPGQTLFFAADGRVFQQLSSRTPQLPDPPFEVEFESGALGSTFLRLPESRSRIRVTLRD